MILGTLQFELYFSNPQSLKEKRHILKSVLTRLRQKFNISIAELGNTDKWQSSIIGAAYIGSSRSDVDRSLNLLLEFLDREEDLEVIRQTKEIW